jgi:hypothetical protein
MADLPDNGQNIRRELKKGVAQLQAAYEDDAAGSRILLPKNQWRGSAGIWNADA